jgi:hypothetical protein
MQFSLTAIDEMVASTLIAFKHTNKTSNKVSYYFFFGHKNVMRIRSEDKYSCYECESVGNVMRFKVMPFFVVQFA